MKPVKQSCKEAVRERLRALVYAPALALAFASLVGCAESAGSADTAAGPAVPVAGEPPSGALPSSPDDGTDGALPPGSPVVVILKNRLVGDIRLINGYCGTPGIGGANLKLRCRTETPDRIICESYTVSGDQCAQPIVYETEAP